jgi:hypothetical protein
MYDDLLAKGMAAGAEPLNDLRDATRLSRVYERDAALARRVGESAKADAMSSRRLELWRHWDRQLPNNAFVARQLQAASPAKE